MNSQSFVSKLSTAINASLPGQGAQYQMAPKHRVPLNNSDNLNLLRPSAVLILICQRKNGEWFIPLIERPAYEGIHSAQISLPGGKFDAADQDLKATAIRECGEEIGITELDIIGGLTQLHIPVSGFLVHPFVGVCRNVEPAMLPDAREVQSVLELNIHDLLTKDLRETGTIEVGAKLRVEAPWFNVSGHRVWGATAMILNEFKLLCQPIY